MSKSVSVDMCAVYVFRLYEDCTLCFFHEQVEPQAFDAEACQQMCSNGTTPSFTLVDKIDPAERASKLFIYRLSLTSSESLHVLTYVGV